MAKSRTERCSAQKPVFLASGPNARRAAGTAIALVAPATTLPYRSFCLDGGRNGEEAANVVVSAPLRWRVVRMPAFMSAQGDLGSVDRSIAMRASEASAIPRLADTLNRLIHIKSHAAHRSDERKATDRPINNKRQFEREAHFGVVRRTSEPHDAHVDPSYTRLTNMSGAPGVSVNKPSCLEA